MNWRDIQILYRRELRAALRERSIVFGSIAMPMLLYPVLLWVMFTAMTFFRGQEERFTSRIAFVDLPEQHQQILDDLEEDGSTVAVEPPPAERIAAAVAAAEVDAVAVFTAPEEESREDERAEDERVEPGLEGNFRVQVSYDSSKDRSSKAFYRVRDAVDSYRTDWLRREAEALDIDEATWQGVRVERRDLASESEKGAFVLGLIVPIMMIVMIAVGCFYPAIDTTAGERERSTWETSMSTAASRSSLVTAKYLYVATLGGAAGLLNLVAMTLTLGWVLTPLLGGEDGGFEFRLPFVALPLLGVTAVLLAMFIAAGMMIFAAFARTFKEGQAMVSPFYMLCILPALFVQSPDLELDLQMALIPIVNVTLLFREAISGAFNWPMIAVTLAVEVATVALCLMIARWVLSFEEVTTGSTGGSLVQFLKRRRTRGKSSPAPKETR